MSRFVPANVRERNSDQRDHRRSHARLDHDEGAKRRRAEAQEREGARRADAGGPGFDERVDEETEPERRQRRAGQIEASRRLRIARLADPARRQHDDQRRDRDVEEEDPAPGGVRGDPAARHRPDRRRDGAPGRPGADGGAALFGGKTGADERQASRHEERRARALNGPGGDEEPDPRRGATGRRGEREHHHPRREDGPPPQPIAERAADQNQRRQQECIGLDDPLQLTDRRAQAPLHDRERDVDDRAVEERHARSQDRHHQRPARIVGRGRRRAGRRRWDGRFVHRRVG